MKKILVRVGFVAAVAGLAVGGFHGADAATHDQPQATKQYCC